jgi:HSP20 family molecular chaperone IbpA
MTYLAKYNAANINQLMERLQRNTIGWDSTLDRVFNHEVSNYPPYNLLAVSENESRLEMALAGFSKEEVKVYTENGRLTVEGNSPTDVEEPNFIHRGLAKRPFTRSWNISDDFEVSEVVFENGLLCVSLTRVVPESHKRRFFLGGEE